MKKNIQGINEKENVNTSKKLIYMYITSFIFKKSKIIYIYTELKQRKRKINFMKYKKMAYLLIIIVVITIVIVLWQNISEGNKNEDKEKGNSEVEFLEGKIEKIFNNMNNIETRNYNISVSENSGDQGTNSNESSNSEKYELEESGVLTNTEQIDWNKIKTEVEGLYLSLPTITIDLYKLNVAKEDVLGFNEKFDQLTINAKSENKQETLATLSEIYEYIPKFIEKVTDDEIEKIAVKTKSEIFKAYSKLDQDKWNEIAQNVKQAEENYSKLLSNTNIDKTKQYRVNKCYVMLNELQNAVNFKNSSVFLIKYQNLLEEIDNI